MLHYAADDNRLILCYKKKEKEKKTEHIENVKVNKERETDEEESGKRRGRCK